MARYITCHLPQQHGLSSLKGGFLGGARQPAWQTQNEFESRDTRPDRKAKEANASVGSTSVYSDASRKAGVSAAIHTATTTANSYTATGTPSRAATTTMVSRIKGGATCTAWQTGGSDNGWIPLQRSGGIIIKTNSREPLDIAHF